MGQRDVIEEVEGIKWMRRPVTKMTAGHYHLIASIIRGIEDVGERRRIAALFGDAFNKRSAVFDYYQWRKACHVE